MAMGQARCSLVLDQLRRLSGGGGLASAFRFGAGQVVNLWPRLSHGGGLALCHSFVGGREF